MEVPHFVVAKGQMQPSYIFMAGSVKSLTVKKVSSVNTFPKGETNYQAIDTVVKPCPAYHGKGLGASYLPIVNRR
jgi:hypothetical protein